MNPKMKISMKNHHLGMIHRKTLLNIFVLSGWLNISILFFSMAPSKNEDFMNQPPPQQQQQQTPQQTPIFEPPQQDFKFGMDYAAGYR